MTQKYRVLRRSVEVRITSKLGPSVEIHKTQLRLSYSVCNADNRDVRSFREYYPEIRSETVPNDTTLFCWRKCTAMHLCVTCCV